MVLGDIFNEIKAVSPTTTQILMNKNIELFGCSACLGSLEVLTQPQEIPTLAVIMEWIFLRLTVANSEQCPKDKVVELTRLFVNNGCTPFQVKGS